ncbi:unnamed protein product, partial [Mesorhabditis belari]|uniref:ENTH domain-containing protein n=1 Tax=Mesorhabditis belari TaxID=2138241 RepID=A0AAF3FIP6_9BILA
MSISTIRRQVKNVAYNFSDAQVKVREATSNDPWGPSTALMSEIADLTNNPMAFTEIMSIVWKRLNDHGKNWRHVYKSLVLLDFLIKCGNEKVAQQCRENIYSIETLKDFQHVEDYRDQGLNIREKAKQMAALLADDERLKNERTRFMLTRNKFRQNGAGVGSEVRTRRQEQSGSRGVPPTEFDDARPSSLGEEEMQLQIALALSREEAEKASEMEKSDDIRLQMALEESKRDADEMSKRTMGTVNSGQLSQSAVDDLLSLGLGDLVVNDPNQPTSSTAWGGTQIADPWASPPQYNNTPAYPTSAQLALNDPWAPSTPQAHAPAATLASNDPFAAWDAGVTNGTNGMETLQPTPANQTLSNNGFSASAMNASRKTPENFLGENSNLVNLDNLLGITNTNSTAVSNPFMLGTATPPPSNPFNAQRNKSPTLNEMRAGAPPIPQVGPRVGALPQPLQPSQTPNPFAGI